MPAAAAAAAQRSTSVVLMCDHDTLASVWLRAASSPPPHSDAQNDGSQRQKQPRYQTYPRSNTKSTVRREGTPCMSGGVGGNMMQCNSLLAAHALPLRYCGCRTWRSSPVRGIPRSDWNGRVSGSRFTRQVNNSGFEGFSLFFTLWIKILTWETKKKRKGKHPIWFVVTPHRMFYLTVAINSSNKSTNTWANRCN